MNMLPLSMPLLLHLTPTAPTAATATAATATAAPTPAATPTPTYCCCCCSSYCFDDATTPTLELHTLNPETSTMWALLKIGLLFRSFFTRVPYYNIGDPKRDPNSESYPCARKPKP